MKECENDEESPNYWLADGHCRGSYNGGGGRCKCTDRPALLDVK